MIRLECTNCKQTLTIEDAFAGGVCRCQYCGTIQTVPANSMVRPRPSPQPVNPADKSKATATAKPPKALYRTPSAAHGVSTAADPFADVAGSGLPGSGLPGSGLPGSGAGGSGFPGSGLPSPRPSRPPTRDAEPPTYEDVPDETALLQGNNAAPLPISQPLDYAPVRPPRTHMVAILIGVSLSVVVLLVVLIIIMTGKKATPEIVYVPPTPTPAQVPAPTPTVIPSPTPSGSNPPAGPNPSPTPANPANPPVRGNTPPVAQVPGSHPNPPAPGAKPANPTFMGVSYANLQSIVIIIDNGASQQAVLPSVNRAVLNTIANMPTGRTIHLEYWDGSAGPSYPANGMSRVTDATAAAVANVMNNAPAATDPTPDAAVQKAVSLKPKAIMFLTGRGIDDATRARLATILAGSATSKVYTFGVNITDSTALKALATGAGGAYHEISATQLANYAR